MIDIAIEYIKVVMFKLNAHKPSFSEKWASSYEVEVAYMLQSCSEAWNYFAYVDLFRNEAVVSGVKIYVNSHFSRLS